MVGRRSKNSRKSAAKKLARRVVKKPSRQTKNLRKSKKIVISSRKRGRPRKSWLFHARKNSAQWLKRSRKSTKRLVLKWQTQFHLFLQTIGLQRKKGRPRKQLKAVQKLRSTTHTRVRTLSRWYSSFSLVWQLRWHKLLQLIGWRRRRGRPRKGVVAKKPLKRAKPIRVGRRKKVRRHWREVFSLLSTITILLLAWWGYQFVFADLPSVLDLSAKNPALTTRILDRNGNLLFRVYENENRTLVPLSEISPELIEATIAIEDKNFYHHRGFSLDGIARAMVANLQGKEIEQGGSTITQQLVKNRLLTRERTIQRKLRELVLSVVAEGVYTKEEILEMYLNQVAYGGSTYGVEEASWRYFNKSVRDLNLAEAALLAGLPQAPSVYSPFSSTPELAFARQEEVLQQMYRNDYITQEEWQAARETEIVFAKNKIEIQAPHFVMYVKKLLAEQYGEDVVQTGGLEVRTTLDLDLQHKAEKVLEDELKRLAGLRVGNGASLVTNPKTGEVLAMVGSRDYFDFVHDGQVNVTLRPRQPGSSIKPLTYALALESGKTPATIIDDAPVIYTFAGSPPYAPKNYDGKFHGKITLREALASSYNVPAVKTLAAIGVENMIDRAEEAGITTWRDHSRFGLSLTLGGGEVTMAELSQLYGVFANAGALVKLNPILEVRDHSGTVLYSNTCVSGQQSCFEKQIFSPQVASLITDILSDNRARTPAFGPQSVLTIPGQEVAVKTGTTNSLRDNWTIGYTTDRLVAVWVGNNDNTPMSYVASGITGASPIWNKTMRLLLDPENPHVFETPDNLIEVSVCKSTGTLSCAGCPIVIKETFVKGTEPKTACNPANFAPKLGPDGQPLPTITVAPQLIPITR